MFGRKYSTCYSMYPGVGKITDEMIAAYVKKHTHWWDRLDYHKISDASQMAFLLLIGAAEEPKEKEWYF